MPLDQPVERLNGLLGRAFASLQVALFVRTVWVSLLAIGLLAAPFVFGGTAVMMALTW